MSKINPFHPHWLQIALSKWCPGCCCLLIWGTQEVCRHGCCWAGYRHKCPRVLGVTSRVSLSWPSCSWGWDAPAPLSHARLRVFPWAFGVPAGLRGVCLAMGYSIHQPTANGATSLPWFSCGSGDVLQRTDLFIKRNFGNFHGDVVAGGMLLTAGNLHQMLLQNHCVQ